MGKVFLQYPAPLRKTCIFLLLAWLLLGQMEPVFANAGLLAQDAPPGGKIVISPVEATAFPEISFYLEAYDSTNQFIPDLNIQDLQVLEDNQPVSLSSLERLEPGLQVILGVNAAPMMASTIDGQSLLARVQAAMAAWAEARPEGSQDEFSMVTNSGQVIGRETDPAKWVEAIQSYNPDLMVEAPTASSLNAAIELAANPLPRARMKRVIFYITPPPTYAVQQNLPNITAMAMQEGVRIFTWMVTGGSTPDEGAIAAVQQMADSTGGQLFIYSGAEGLPDPEQFLAPLRYVYKAAYTSRATTSGDHTVNVNLVREGAAAQGQPGSYGVQVSPPNPIFLSPPTQVERTWTQPEDKNVESKLTPASTELQILVEFPDGHPRPLRATRLYVDDLLMAENTAEPFDQLTWPLQDYVASQRFTLKVEVEDSLGLRQVSIGTQVEVIVQPQQLTLWERIRSDRRIIIGASLLVSGTVLIMVLVRTGRRTWQSASRRRKKKARDPNDPVSQPVPILQADERRAAGRSPSRPRPSAAAAEPKSGPNHNRILAKFNRNSEAPARLVRLTDEGDPIPAVTVLVNRTELTFGRDPHHAIHILDAPSVEALHARLAHTEDNRFLLYDCGSVAGTWVNYAPVSALGVRLEHGDLVHIGRVAFRFELLSPGAQRRVVVKSLTDD